MGDLWVFGYGSLMWRPGFDAVETSRARIHGYRRALCVRSHVHRGTPERPGLVLGLDRGGSCIGMAFRVGPDAREAVLAYLRDRELVTNVYVERLLPARLDDGRRIEAVSYVVDRGHVQYAGAITPDDAAATVSDAAGISGRNPDYVFNTVGHLTDLGIRDHWLEQVAALVRSRPGRP